MSSLKTKDWLTQEQKVCSYTYNKAFRPTEIKNTKKIYITEPQTDEKYYTKIQHSKSQQYNTATKIIRRNQYQVHHISQKEYKKHRK